MLVRCRQAKQNSWCGATLALLSPATMIRRIIDTCYFSALILFAARNVSGQRITETSVPLGDTLMS
jgi:hypothetical protein